MSLLEVKQGRKVGNSWSSRHRKAIILRISINELHHELDFFKKLWGFFPLFPFVRSLMPLVFMCFKRFFKYFLPMSCKNKNASLNTFRSYCPHISIVWHRASRYTARTSAFNFTHYVHISFLF